VVNNGTAARSNCEPIGGRFQPARLIFALPYVNLTPDHGDINPHYCLH